MRLLPLAALLLAACAPKPVAIDPLGRARPAVWKVADADTTIYLFGTIHVLPAAYPWRNGAVTGAIDAAQALVLETVVGPDPAALSATMLAMGRAGGLPPLLSRVPEGKRAALSALIARSGVPPAMLDGMKTWAAALLLVGTTLADMKLTAGEGVEPQLEAAFRARRLPVEGLETPAEQLGFFDGLPEAAQRDFLATLAEDGAVMREDYDAMLAAWSRGDAKAIAATFDEELKESAALREALLVRRNANWAKWLGKRLETPGTVMVAVGAGHLVGRDSVQAMLAKDGVKAERLP
ncbi:MAG: TraB/GumN family protein [Sphingomonas sp.]